MRVMTVRQPWAHAIVHQGKDVENRVRNIAGSYRGPVAIHAGLKRFDPRDEAGDRVATITGYRPLMFLPQGYGHIIGVVDLVDVHLCSGDCSPWADGPVDLGDGVRDIWHLRLASPRELAEPIPFKGALGLRELDAEMVARIETAIA